MFWLFKYLLYVMGSGVTLTAGLASYLAFLQPNFQFPQPTGNHAVGTMTFHWVDEKRIVKGDNGEQPKELMVQCWYPCNGDKATQKPVSPYAPYMINNMKKNYTIPWLLLMSRPMFTYAVEGAPLLASSDKLPVVIFSHGFGTTRSHNEANCQELASHGFVVFAVSHSWGCGVVEFPNERISVMDQMKTMEKVAKDPLQNLREFHDNIEIWIDDVQMVLDKLTDVTADQMSPLYNKLDLQNIGMFGHSYGGSTTIQLCRRDARIKAGVDMDGALFGQRAVEPFNKPCMFLLAQQMSKEEMRVEMERIGMQKDLSEYIDALYATYVPAINALTNAIGHDTYTVFLKNAKHMAFCDLALIKETNYIARLLGAYTVGTINGFRATEIINAYLVAFLNKYLKNMPSPLLDSETKFPEVEVQ